MSNIEPWMWSNILKEGKKEGKKEGNKENKKRKEEIKRKTNQ